MRSPGHGGAFGFGAIPAAGCVATSRRSGISRFMPPERMPAERSGEQGPEKLSLLVLSGTFERVHYSLVLASAAAAIGKPATLFFTDRALRALQAGARSRRPTGRAAAPSTTASAPAAAPVSRSCCRGASISVYASSPA